MLIEQVARQAEYRMFHRKDGVIVKKRDELMAATRYGIMMLRQTKTEPEN